MALRILTLLLIICCTSKPDAAAPSDPANPGLSFGGLGGALKHNVPFQVSVAVTGDIAVSSSSDATQALTIVLSQRAGTGDWQPVGEQVAANNSATFDLTLPSGSYTLKAETRGAATLSQESSPFTVVDNVGGAVDGIKLSFTEDIYTTKPEDLFDVTIAVTESSKIAVGSQVELKLLKDDGSEVGKLMHWKPAMQPPGAAVAAEVDTDDGKVEFKDLFIVDGQDVAKLQAVLEYEGSSLTAEAEFNIDTAAVVLEDVVLSHGDNSNLVNNFNFNPDSISRSFTDTNPAYGFDLYFFKAGSDPPVISGPRAGSAVPYRIDKAVADFSKHCYDIAVRITGAERRAFWHEVAKSRTARKDCKQ